MLAKRGRKRAKPLKPAKELVTRRVRRLVDLAHDGNVHEASKVSGVPSATIRALYSGKRTNPSLRTLEKLGEAYGFYTSWFTDPAAPEAVPLGGLAFKVQASDSLGAPTIIRQFTIPWASWPLPDVYRRLYEYLLSLPSDPQRPIIGEFGEGSDSAAKVALFLLGPLDAARSLTGVEQYGDFEPIDAGDEQAEAHIRRLRRLGTFWQDALHAVLHREMVPHRPGQKHASSPLLLPPERLAR